MNWIHLLSLSKDHPGQSEEWNVEVAVTSDGGFAWRTTPRADDADEFIDGPPDLIAEYLIEHAYGVEAELISGLTEVVQSDCQFSPLLDAVRTRV